MKTPYPATAPSQMAPSAMSLACKKSLSLSLSQSLLLEAADGP